MGYGNCTLTQTVMPPQNCFGVFQPFDVGCGFHTNHSLPVYSSVDLATWRYEGDALPVNARPFGIYFRPKIVFDHRSDEFVLWINYLRKQGPRWPQNTPLQSYTSNISIVVARAQSLRGPFAIVEPWAKLQISGVGDFALLVSSDKAYVAYDAWDNGHRIRIEALNEAWTGSRLDAHSSSGDLSEADVEAPMLFERHGYFYLVYGSTCCFCPEGGGAVVQVYLQGRMHIRMPVHTAVAGGMEPTWHFWPIRPTYEILHPVANTRHPFPL